MGVNSPHYVGSNWPSNEGSYNWDVELTCSWNMGLRSVFSHCGNTRRGSWAPHLGVVVVLKRELQTLYRASVWNAGLELRVWAPRWCWNASFKLCIELHVWDTGFKLCVLALKWCWDTGFEPCVLALQWYRGACFEPRVLALHEWLWLVSRLKYGLCISRLVFSDF